MKTVKVTNCTTLQRFGTKIRKNQNVIVLLQDETEVNENLLKRFQNRWGNFTSGTFIASKTSKIIPCG